MKTTSLVVFGLLVVGVVSSPSHAQTDYEKAQNLATCLSGRYPSLCKTHWLTPEEAKKAERAERQANLETCLTGRYPSLCNRSKLSPDEAHRVLAAEKRENLQMCLSGRYKSLCKTDLLSAIEREQALAAERAENLRICLSGSYPSLCDRSLLTTAQLAEAQVAEKRNGGTQKQRAAKVPAMPSRHYSSSGCEAGHWVDSVSDDGEIVKLEDGSVWEVDAGDTVDSALWLPTTDIVVCDDKLINTDDNETVHATRLR